MAVGQAEQRDAGSSADGPAPFRHAALLYDGDADFLAGARAFIEEGLDAGEPALVSVPAVRLRPLAEALGAAAEPMVQFVPMEDLGRNPAWIIPAWADFVGPHVTAGRAVRGIGEPIWTERTDDELVECARHESLLNLAMADAAGFSLLCPYDVGSLDQAVLADAHHHHPEVCQDGSAEQSTDYAHSIPTQLADPLPAPPDDAEMVTFGPDDAWSVRTRVSGAAGDAGLDPERLEDLAVVVSEALTNTVEHGGGSGEIAWWNEADRFLCEIRDHGTIADPLVGRVRPSPIRAGGRGMWLMHQLCDLVQIRVLPGDAKVIRLHLAT